MYSTAAALGRLSKGPALQLFHLYGISAQAAPDVRTELSTAVKAAMKSKDTLASTTLRGVLAEVYSADKAAHDQKVASSTIISILRKAAARRTEAAAQFTAAARPDLAEKEIREANVLSQFLPPLLTEADIDSHLQKILDRFASAQKPGIIFKEFYSVVDKSTVDPRMVKERLDVLLNA
ncbi:Yqey-like protein-domain-containing protein [Mycena galericulata]|nr:Yqey-like protein-domain-containing protein [Mycena galericulata]